MAHPAGYSRAQIALHWLTALVVVAAWLLRERMEETFDAVLDDGVAAALPLHGWLGLTVLALTVLRLALRLTRGAPPPPEADPPALRAAAHWGHWLIYALLVGVPLGGALTWFGRDEGLGDLHGTAASLLMILALGHALVALWHQYGKRDGLLLRMMRPR